MNLRVIVAIVTKIECLLGLNFNQFCMPGFERNIDGRNLKEIFVYYQIQCLGRVPKYSITVQKAPMKSTIIFLNVKTVHAMLQYLYQILEKFAYFLFISYFTA